MGVYCFDVFYKMFRCYGIILLCLTIKYHLLFLNLPKSKKKIVQPASKDNCGQYGNWGYKNRHPFLNRNH